MQLAETTDVYFVDDRGSFQVDVPQGSYVFCPGVFRAGGVTVTEWHGPKDFAADALCAAIVSRI